MATATGNQLAVPLVALGSASVLAAAIVVTAPEVGMLTLTAMIAVWVALGIVRLVILLGVARQLYLRHHALAAS